MQQPRLYVHKKYSQERIIHHLEQARKELLDLKRNNIRDHDDIIEIINLELDMIKHPNRIVKEIEKRLYNFFKSRYYIIEIYSLKDNKGKKFIWNNRQVKELYEYFKNFHLAVLDENLIKASQLWNQIFVDIKNLFRFELHHYISATDKSAQECLYSLLEIKEFIDKNI